MKKEESNIPWWQPGMQMFLRLSGWIGGPIIVAVFIGKWLDKKYNSEPWLFLLTVGIAFVVSMIVIVKIGLEELNKIEKDSKNNSFKK